MSWWNAKYKNNHGEYEITFASKDYEKAKAVEKVCCAVMDKSVKSPFDVEVVVRCRECKHAYINSFSAASGVALCRLLTKRAEGIQIVMQQDDFCSYGERKEGADNG